MRIAALIALFALTVFAEESKEAKKADADPRKLKPDHAPTPFTADQIWEATPAGRRTTLKMQRSVGPAMMQTFHFKTSDVAGTVIETLRHAEGKPPPARGSQGHSTWRALQQHASYPASATKITEEVVETPLGKFACFVYTVTAGENVNRICFAKALPGPPVLMTSMQKGKEVFRLSITRHRDGTEAKILAALAKMPDGDIARSAFAVEGLTKTQLARAFDRVDRNADGKLDNAEREHAKKAWTPKPNAKAK